MVNAVGSPTPTTPAKKAEEKKDENKPEAQSPTPAPAPAPAPNTDNAGSDDVNTPTNGLDSKTAFQVGQALKKPKTESGNTGGTENGSVSPSQQFKKGDSKKESPQNDEPGNRNSDGSAGVGRGKPRKAPDKPEESVTLGQVQDYHEEALEEKETLDVLTDSKMITTGEFKGKSIVEKMAGDDGKLSLKEAKEARANVRSNLEEMQNAKLVMPSEEEKKDFERQIEKAETLDKALNNLTTDGTFERLAGDNDYIDIDGLNKAKDDNEEKIDNLGKITSHDNFDYIAGGDGLLSEDDIKATAKNGVNNNSAKTAAEWLSTDENFDDMLSSSKNSKDKITKESATKYAYDHLEEFDTGGGVYKKDGKFGIDDLNELAKGDDKTAKNAKALIDGDIVGDLGGKDGKISKEDLEDHFDEVSNGEIDPFSQQNEGNCWWLTGIGTVANSKEGRDIIKESITKNEDGNYVVNFKGEPDKTYVVPSDIAEGSNSNEGDQDIKVLSEAARMYFRELPEGRSSMKDGGFAPDARELLTGKKSESIGKDDRDKLEEVVKNNPDGLMMDFAAKPGDDGVATKGDGHSYGVRNIDFENDTVTYFNPWNSDEDLTMSVDEFLQMTDIRYS